MKTPAKPHHIQRIHTLLDRALDAVILARDTTSSHLIVAPDRLSILADLDDIATRAAQVAQTIRDNTGDTP